MESTRGGRVKGVIENLQETQFSVELQGNEVVYGLSGIQLLQRLCSW